MFNSFNLKNNNLSNPYHSGYNKHLVDKSQYEIKIENLEKSYKKKLYKTIEFIKLCFYKKNILKTIKEKYNHFVYRDIIINRYHTPLKNTFLRKVRNRRIPEIFFLKLKPYLDLLIMPFHPYLLFLSKTLLALHNKKVYKLNKKAKKKHFSSFTKVNRYNKFSIKENKRRIKNELNKRGSFKKICLNKFSLATLALSLSITGVVVANPTYDNRDILNIFNEGDVTMHIFPSNYISNIDFSGENISAYYRRNSNIAFYLPSGIKINQKKSSFLVNVKPTYAGLGNYIHKPSSDEKSWFQNLGIIQEDCYSSLFLVNLKHMVGEDGKFTVRTNRLSEPNRMIDVVYKAEEHEVLYYIKDYDYYTNKRNKVASFVCKVEKNNALHNKINKIVKKM